MNAAPSLRLDDDEVQVWSASLDALEGISGMLAGLLSREEEQRAARFYFDHHRRRYIAGRALLRRLIGAYLAFPPKQITFGYEACGKPFLSLPSAHPALHFNLSHSNQMALYAFSWRRLVGIDLEMLRPMPTADNIAAEYFSHNESAAVASLDGKAKLALFFKVWTAKEAYVKGIGEGLSAPLDKIELRMGAKRSARLLSLNGRGDHVDRWRLELFTPARGYQAALAVEGHDWRLCFREVGAFEPV